MEQREHKVKTLVENRKAKYNYYSVDGIVTGIVLTGPEVKAIRNGKCKIDEAYVIVDHDGQLKVLNMYITTENGGFKQTAPDQPRVLLARKKQIQYMKEFSDEPGYTLIPCAIMDNGKGLIKVMVGLCKGKRDYDKRQSLKEREHQREMDRATKSFE